MSKDILKKILTVFYLTALITLVLGVVNVHAANKNVYFIKEIGFIKSHDSFTTPNGFKKDYNGSQDNYILSHSDNLASSGDYVYCVEPGVHLNGGATVNSNNSASTLFKTDKGVTTASEKMELVSLIAGRDGFMKTWEGAEGWKSKTKYLVGQVLIWEVVGGARDANFNLRSSNYSLKNIYHFTDWDGETPGTASEIKEYFNDRYDTWSEQIQNILKEEKKISYANGNTYELLWDKSSNKFMKSFKDDNKVTGLFNYAYSKSNVVWSSKSSDGNTLTFATYDGVTIPKNNPVTITFTGKTGRVASQVLGWIPSEGKQKSVSFGSNSTKSITCNLKVYTKGFVDSGSIQISKVDSVAGKNIPIGGVTFDIKAEEDIINTLDNSVIYKKGTVVSTIKTNDKGIAVGKDLQPGKYVVVEKSNPDVSYIMDTTPKSVIVSSGNISDVTVVNVSDTMVGKLKLVKMDDDGSTVSGAEFMIRAYEKITDPSGTAKVYYEKGDIVAQGLVTDENGELIYYNKGDSTVDKDYALHPGKYEIIETKAPDGYILDSTPHIVTVSPNGREVIDVSISITNNMSKVIFSKKDDEGNLLSGAEFELVDVASGEVIDSWVSSGDVYIKDGLSVGKTYRLVEKSPPNGYATSDSLEFVVEGTPQEVSVVNYKTVIRVSKKSITGDDELPGAELTVFDKNGEVVDTWVSGSEPHYIEKLVVGDEYTLVETIPADGHVTANDIKFIIEDTKEVQLVEMIDDITKVAVHKVDVDNNYVSGAELSILDKESGDVIASFVSGDCETIFEKVFTVGKTYILREDKAPEGYVKASDIEFTVLNTSELQSITMVDKVVSVTKVDITDGKELPGAEIVVVDKETGEEVDKWVSTDKPHNILNLEEGREYILEEKIAPEGYYTAEKIEFKVEGLTKEGIKINQHYTMEDAPILTDIIVNKVDSSTNKSITSKDFTFSLYSDESCKTLIATADGNKETGVAVFNDLRYGIYYIKESSAPEGYKLSDEVIKVVIDGSLEGKGDSYSIVFKNVKKELKVVNKPNEESKAPTTGDGSLGVGFSLIVCLLSIAALIVVRRVFGRKIYPNKL